MESRIPNDNVDKINLASLAGLPLEICIMIINHLSPQQYLQLAQANTYFHFLITQTQAISIQQEKQKIQTKVLAKFDDYAQHDYNSWVKSFTHKSMKEIKQQLVSINCFGAEWANQEVKELRCQRLTKLYLILLECITNLNMEYQKIRAQQVTFSRFSEPNKFFLFADNQTFRFTYLCDLRKALTTNSVDSLEIAKQKFEQILERFENNKNLSAEQQKLLKTLKDIAASLENIKQAHDDQINKTVSMGQI